MPPRYATRNQDTGHDPAIFPDGCIGACAAGPGGPSIMCAGATGVDAKSTLPGGGAIDGGCTVGRGGNNTSALAT